MKIFLGKQCTIRQLSGQKEKLKNVLSVKRKKITFEVSELEKIDTAFLQVLLSVIESCRINGIKYEIQGKSKALDSILECYGFTI